MKKYLYYVKDVGYIGRMAIRFSYKRILEADNINTKQFLKFKKI